MGLWVTYVTYDETVVTEWYNSNDIDDNTWKSDANWRQGSNMLVGDISISSEGNWVINGVDSGFPARGEKGENGDKLLVRLSTDKTKIEYSYDDKLWQELFPLSLITPTVQVAPVALLEPGLNPTATNIGNPFDVNLQLGLPKSPTINVGSVYTLPAGSTVKVVNSGTQYKVVLDFSIPMGNTGAKGEKGDGVNRWNNLDYLAAENITQELGSSETATVSQKVITEAIDEQKYKLYSSMSISGMPGIDPGHFVDFTSSVAFNGYKEDPLWDCAWVLILKGSKFITITGAISSTISYYSSTTPTAESYLGIGPTIPSTAKRLAGDVFTASFRLGGGFHVTTANPSFIAGATYSDSNNPDIIFTVVSYDPTSGFLTTTASGSFQSEGNMTGVLTKLTGLGTSIVEYNQLRTVPGQTYFSKSMDVNGKWIQLQYDTVKEGWPISPKGNMDYDRMDILVRTSAGTSFTLKDINLKCNVSQVKKDSRNIYKSFALGVESQDGVQILNNTTFENAVTDWGAPSDAVIWDGKVTYTGPTGTEITGNHIPTYFSSKKGVTRIIRLNAGMSMAQNFNRHLGASYVARRYKMKIVARFYPTEAIDENNLPADVRTSETWDFARFEVKIAIGNNSSWYSRTYYAPLNFVEIEDEWLFDGDEAINNVMTITALDDRIEFLTAEVIAE